MTEQPNRKVHFVHRYDVVRVKVAVNATDHKEAMKIADEHIINNMSVAHPHMQRAYGMSDEMILDIVKHAPFIMEREFAEEITGYMVDEEGDEEFVDSVSYDETGEPSCIDDASRTPYLLNDAEHATVLAALRFYQRRCIVSQEPEYDIATNDGEFEPLDNAAIDDLCERINC